MLLWTLQRGDAPLLLNVPHAGRYVPDAIAMRLTPQARNLADTDWHVEKLAAVAPSMGITLLVATHSRYVVDLNRDPSGQALYAGADNTELCPLATFAREPIYLEGESPSPTETQARKAVYFDTYHAQMRDEIDRVRAMHGHAIVLDLHSIRSEVPRFFSGRLPDLNLGTSAGQSCAPEVRELATGLLHSAADFSHVVDGRFKGGYITRNYGKPAQRIHALQLETAQSAYMDENPPFRWDAARASRFAALLERLLVALMEWRPSSGARA
ncbi:MAG TPA: N-formylglutamate deformylase [Casimicrobiaceae bacterium]|nr:N-formylglutamate deformylase [Casimicrobiaceae bacterium]